MTTSCESTMKHAGPTRRTFSKASLCECQIGQLWIRKIEHSQCFLNGKLLSNMQRTVIIPDRAQLTQTFPVASSGPIISALSSIYHA